MAGDKGKGIVVHLSSSSSDDDVLDEGDSASSSLSSGEEWASNDEDDDDHDVDMLDDSEDVEDGEDDDDEGEGEGEDVSENRRRGANDADDDDDDDDSLCNRVIQYLQEKKDLHELSLKACKAYLRKHGLRVSGNKDVCVRRVKEHWRIKDGKAEILYPRSSFVINCKGDVCKGDIVLFTQKVYGSFDKVKRNGKRLGYRIVAGRVIKESYGAAKQQHTFTVEVLWSKGVKKLQPLFPLLVKGRNLYRLKTYRQPWKNEAARRVLAEKHRRGTVARKEREKRKKAQSTRKGGKSQKASHCAKQSQEDYSRRGRSNDRDQRPSSSKERKHSAINQHFHDVKHGGGAHVIEAKSSEPFPRHENLIVPAVRASELRSYYDPSNRYPQLLGESHHKGVFQNKIHCPVILPNTPHNGFIPFTNGSYGVRSQWVRHVDSLQFLPGQGGISLLKCSIQGCNECGTDRCVIGACWKCCKRERMGCTVHR